MPWVVFLNWSQIIWCMLSQLCTWACITSTHLSYHKWRLCWIDFHLFYFVQYFYSALMEEYAAVINVRRKNKFHIDSAEDLHGERCLYDVSPHQACVWVMWLRTVVVTYCTALLNIKIMLFAHRLPLLCLVSVTLFNCSVGRQDCSRCRTADPKYGCVWCGGAAGSRCVYQDSCNDEVQHTCPAPVIHFVRGYFFN